MRSARHGLARWLMLRCGALALAAAAFCLTGSARADDDLKPIAFTKLERKEPVSFSKEVLPVLSKNCLSCHNAAKAENNLILETPQAMQKGGEDGPAIVPGKSAESLLLKVAAHQTEPAMPPGDNNVGAKDLTPEELGLLAAWIDQGAIADMAKAAPVKWQSLPATVQPIYATAVSPDAEYAACTRGNQIFVYQLPSGQLAGRLVDPELTKSELYKDVGAAHFDLVQSLAFSPDGDRLASGAYREIKLWQRRRNASSAGWILPQEQTALAISPDGKLAAIGDAQGAITLWDLTTGQAAKTLTGHTGAVTCLTFNGPETVVSGSQDASLRLWKVADGTQIVSVDAQAPITALAILTGGKRIITGSADNNVRIWKAGSKPEEANVWTSPATLGGHKAPVTAMAVSPVDKDKHIFYSGSADGSIRQWTLDSKTLDAGAQTRETDAGGPIAGLAIRPDGLQLASVNGTNLVKLWKVENGQPWTVGNDPLPEIKGDVRAAARAAAAKRMADLLTAQVADSKKAVTDTEAKIAAAEEAKKTATAAKDKALVTKTEKAEAVKAPMAAKEAADAKLVAAAALVKTAQDALAPFQQALEKDAENAELKQLVETAKKLADDSETRRKAVEEAAKAADAALTTAKKDAAAAEAGSQAAERLAAAATTAHAKVAEALPALKVTTGVIETRLADATAKATAAGEAAAALEKPLRTVAYSPDGSQVIVGGENKTVYAFNSSTGLGYNSFEGHTAPVVAVAVSAVGNPISIAADKGVIVWQGMPTWQLERVIGHVDDPSILVDRVLALSFDPSGTLLASGGGEPSRSGELKLWNVTDGSLVRTISPGHSDTVFGLDFSPDGLLLASGAADRIVKVFDVASGALANSFEGHTHHVLDVAWAADGKMLASAGADCVIKFWDYASGDQLRASQPLEKEATSIAFVGGTKNLISAWGDRAVRLFDSDTAKVDRDFRGATDFLYSVTVTSDGQTVVAGGQDSKLLEWNLEDRKLLQTIAPAK